MDGTNGFKQRTERAKQGCIADYQELLGKYGAVTAQMLADKRGQRRDHVTRSWRKFKLNEKYPLTHPQELQGDDMVRDRLERYDIIKKAYGNVEAEKLAQALDISYDTLLEYWKKYDLGDGNPLIFFADKERDDEMRRFLDTYEALQKDNPHITAEMISERTGVHYEKILRYWTENNLRKNYPLYIRGGQVLGRNMGTPAAAQSEPIAQADKPSESESLAIAKLKQEFIPALMKLTNENTRPTPELLAEQTQTKPEDVVAFLKSDQKMQAMLDSILRHVNFKK